MSPLALTAAVSASPGGPLGVWFVRDPREVVMHPVRCGVRGPVASAEIGDLRLDTDGHIVEQVADAVLARTQWPR
ncbi:hypothetical protein ACFT8W_40800 [Streptomyces hygroscopicus]|uniref:hypothetical protein n=1 Tax=Streptomyces hygroscopicus TaxID=1912 RepID=UPI003629799B